MIKLENINKKREKIKMKAKSYCQPGLFVVSILANGESAAKKGKHDESRSDDSASEDDDDNMNKKPVVNGKGAKAASVQKKDKSSDDREMRNQQLQLIGQTECNLHDW